MRVTKLLLVEDDASVRSTLSTFLELEGYEVNAAASTKEALELLSAASFPVIVSDVYIDQPDGVGCVERGARAGPGLPRDFDVGSGHDGDGDGGDARRCVRLSGEAV